MGREIQGHQRRRIILGFGCWRFRWLIFWRCGLGGRPKGRTFRLLWRSVRLRWRGFCCFGGGSGRCRRFEGIVAVGKARFLTVVILPRSLHSAAARNAAAPVGMTDEEKAT